MATFSWHIAYLFNISNKNNAIKCFGFSFGCYTCSKKCYIYWVNKKNLNFRLTPDDLDLYIYECIGNLKSVKVIWRSKFFLFPK